MKKLIWSSHFEKSAKKYLKLFPQNNELFKTKIIQLSLDIYHPSLKTHKLKGALKNKYSCTITYSHRLIFKIVENDIYLLEIGSHEEVY